MEVLRHEHVQVAIGVDVRRRPAVMEADDVLQSGSEHVSVLRGEQDIGGLAGERGMVVAVTEYEYVDAAIPIEIAGQRFASVDGTGDFGAEETGGQREPPGSVVRVEFRGQRVPRSVTRRIEDVGVPVIIEVSVRHGGEELSPAEANFRVRHSHSGPLE